MRSQARGEDPRFIKFLWSALNDVIFSGIIFFIIRDFLAHVVFWEYAELRTNVLVTVTRSNEDSAQSLRQHAMIRE